MNNSTVSIETYIRRCIKDACAAVEAKPEDYKFWSMQIDDTLILHMKEACDAGDAVFCRVIYRLANNIEKNTGGTCVDICTPLLKDFNINNVNHRFSMRPEYDFIASDAICRVDVFGEGYVIHDDNNPPFYMMDIDFNNIWKTFLENGYDAYLPGDQPGGTFKSFEKAFKIIFGATPSAAYVRAYHHNPIPDSAYGVEEPSDEEVAKKNFQVHNCYYFTVCNKACKQCEKDDGKCRRTPPVHKDGYVARRYRELRAEKISEEV